MTIYESSLPPIADRQLTLTQRVLEGLTNRPEEVVLVDGPSGAEVTAAQLVQDIQALAGGLAAAGFGPGQVAGLMAPNMPAFGTVLHGALWAGGTVTSINPTYTMAEVRHQLIDAKACMLFVTAAQADMAREAAKGTDVTRVIVLDDPGDMAAAMGTPLTEQVPIDPASHVALLPYSSGTTGLPKGVQLTHRALVSNIDQMLEMEILVPGERAVCFLPFFHIYGMQVVLNAFLVGGATVITLPRFDLEGYLRLNQDHRARALWVVPPVALALAKHPMVEAFDLSAVEMVMSAAAPLGGDIADQLGARLGCTAIQAYGMTEASPAVTVTPFSSPRSGTVGTLVPSTQARIVDATTGANCGPGEDGEVWVKGPQLMTSYLNRPEATADTLTDDGWMRTGDIGHFDEDGYLFITDRLKELIKVKGFQVAPAELEAELVTHPQIADAAVIGIPDEGAGEVPMAFLVRAPESDLSEAAAMEYLAGRLATYKQIHRVAFVEAIPKSASGKILRRVLREQV